jgi:hypothetical protein
MSVLRTRSARAQDSIGSTIATQNQVTRETPEATKPLSVGDSVHHRSDVVRTGADSLAKPAVLDSTNLAVGPNRNLRINRFPDWFAWINIHDAMEAARYQKEGT